MHNGAKRTGIKTIIAMAAILFAAYWVADLLPRLVLIWVKLLLLSSLVICKFLLPKKDEESSLAQTPKMPWITLDNLITIVAILLIFDARYYCFLNGYPPLFLVISLILGIAIGIGVTISKHKNEPSPPKVPLSLIIGCLLATVACYILILHANYVLDFSEPEQVATVIEDKKHVNRRKGADSYKFTITVDGKTEQIEVTSHVYNNYKEGDSYIIEKHQGAFDSTFYLPGN